MLAIPIEGHVRGATPRRIVRLLVVLAMVVAAGAAMAEGLRSIAGADALPHAAVALTQPTFACPARSVPPTLEVALSHLATHVYVPGSGGTVCKEDYLLALAGLPILNFNSLSPDAAERTPSGPLGTLTNPGAEVRNANGSVIGFWDPAGSGTFTPLAQAGRLPAR